MEEDLLPETSGDFVRLNVGGEIMVTTLSTLQSVSSCMLAKMFGEKWRTSSLPRDRSGAYMIDADPRYFRVILNFLRRGEIVIDDNVNPAGVLAEAKYFNVDKLVTYLSGGSVLSENVKWSDIGGLSGVKKELQNLVENTIKYASLFKQCGVSPSKNLLLYGPPGCGKTMLAKALACEMKANFLMIKCPELINGDGHTLIRAFFDRAAALQPCVMFFEEFECVARMRQSGDANDSLISQMAINLDFVSSSDKIFVVATTNRPDLIETALLRPGRLDRLIYIPMPNSGARLAILNTTLRKAPLADSVNLNKLADLAQGLSGADLYEICQRACKLAINVAIEKGKPQDMKVDQADLETALKYARRSVLEEDLYRFDHFNRIVLKMLKKAENPA